MQGSAHVPPNAYVPPGSPGNHAVRMMYPVKSPRNDSTTDQPIQYPKVATGPMSVVYFRQPSFA